ncbi:MAG: response regulator transcription factor [Ruminococcus sp.]|jgi:DNA-binding response OmpR family regulator|nr:response regulator transcription factor [Ruminococcus sp.]
MKAKVLLVEDNKQLNDANRRYLELSGYEVETAFFISDAREKLFTFEPDVILLDVMLPDGDGVDFCKEIYGKTDAMIIFLTAKAEEEDTVRGLHAGGHVYLTKPYSPTVMLSYVERAVRIKNANKEKLPEYVTLGKLTMNLPSVIALWDGVDLLLSVKEFAILLLLVQNHGKVLSAKTLYETVWKAPLIRDKNALWRHISSLRHKLFEAAGDSIEITSGRGAGYMINIAEG